MREGRERERERERGRLLRELFGFLFLFFGFNCDRGSFSLTSDSFSPHTLNAKELYQAHLTPYLEKAQETLDSKLEKTQSENAELAEKIQQQRQEIESLLASVEGVVGDLEGAVKATTEFDTEGNLRKEVLEMDEAVKASPQP